MVNKVIFLFALLAASLGMKELRAQIVVTVNPPNPSNFYLDDVWNMQVVNTGSEFQSIIEAEIRYRGMTTPIVKLISSPVHLKWGMNGLSSMDLRTVNVEAGPSYPEAQSIISNKTLSFGDYEICIFIFEESSYEEKGRGCLDYEFNPVTPPILIAPSYCEEITTQTPLFIWTPPMPYSAGTDIIYDLKIAEVRDGQSYEDAINRNIPHHQANDLTETQYLYPIMGEELDSGETYVWQISARIRRPGKYETRDDDGYYRSIGISEVWCFKLPKTEEVIPVPKTHIYPKRVAESGHSTVTNEMFFAYKPVPGPEQIEVSFINEKTHKKLSYGTSLTAERGDNRYMLNLKETGQFRSGTYYTMVIESSRKEKSYIRFKYNEN